MIFSVLFCASLYLRLANNIALERSMSQAILTQYGSMVSSFKGQI